MGKIMPGDGYTGIWQWKDWEQGGTDREDRGWFHW